MKKLILLCSTAVVMPTAAFAQSTGSVDFEKEIVVTGSRVQEVGGIQTPDTAKAKAVLTQEMIARQNPGQTILDTVNLVPGVSFQNNDAYGSSGGTLTIRGFDSSRISLTFDGIPLNDSGNYAIYSNQQLDPELIEQVNVNLGTTDVDSPTASAVGGTVNYRSITPSKKMGGRFAVSIGQFDFRRFFGLFETGELTSSGTRAWVSASTAKNDNPYNNYGKVDKQQYNAKIYQPLGNNGDFIAVSGHYNQNRNNFFGSVALRNDLAVPNGFPQTKDAREYNILYPCTTDAPQAGIADSPNGCGNEFDRRYNPSNTGNIRGSSRFTLSDGLILTIDPSFQYVKANGGGTTTAREFGYDINPTGGRANCATTPNSATVNCIAGYYGGSPYAGGVDLNGDGDKLDQIRVIAPSQTRTKRIGVISGLRWDLDDKNTIRFSYTYDHANHRQTGQVGLLATDGEPLDVFPVNDPLLTAGGDVLQKRDRQSYAILHQFAGEYRGEFGALTATIGARLPFFKRDLQNNCFTSSASGFVECSGQNAAIDTAIQTNNPTYSLPQRRVLKYNKLLPNIGLLYDVAPSVSVFGSYAKGLSVPGTDNLYNAFFFPVNTPQAKPAPETTDSFDLGVRYRSSKIQAQLSTWYTKFNNRTASAYDPDLNATVYRNLGRVNKWGVDGSVAFSVAKEFTLYTFGSWNQSKIKDNIQLGAFGTGVNQVTDCNNIPTGALASDVVRSCAFTAGNREAGSPKYTYGFSALGTLGPVDLGVTAKRTGPRYIFDNNSAVHATGVNLTNLNDTNAANDPAQVFGAKAPAYWLVNLDARLNMGYFDQKLSKTYVQFNVYNLFNKLYVGGFGGGLAQAFNTANTQYGNPPFVQIGAPRTASVSVSVGF